MKRTLTVASGGVAGCGVAWSAGGYYLAGRLWRRGGDRGERRWRGRNGGHGVGMAVGSQAAIPRRVWRTLCGGSNGVVVA